ncbi:MAG TPA: tRNA-guanine transglycosylase [Candidatus Moranbacteria bacterium]|nr:tRNA-guanine transglycosylase [Candidatus Moranbacteria bacterium]
MRKLTIKNKKYSLPIYLPDATRAVVRGLDTMDLEVIGIEGVVVNTYHLMTQPGLAVLKKAGGVKGLMRFNGLVVSDSGGWQIFSTIKRTGSTLSGEITDEGVLFGFGGKKKEIFTPEKSIQVQFAIGSDILICLDDFTAPEAKAEAVKESVERTILWAKRSRKEFDSLVKRNKLTAKNRPHLFAVIQGGWNKNLRKYCAEELLKIGFDGFGYGGYTVNEKREQDLKMAKFVADLIPEEFPKFALGSGQLVDIARMHELGWQIFDCVLPTRDARHGRLYLIKKVALENPEKLKLKSGYQFLSITRGKYANDLKPIDEDCDCLTCQNYSRAYLNHLFKIGDSTYFRLATMHNLRQYVRLVERLRLKS